MGLSEKTIRLVKASALPVSENAEAITSKMYAILFSNHPELEELFEDAGLNQHKKLAHAISAYAANIEDLKGLDKAIEKIAASHIRANIKEEHYPMVGISLLTALKQVLGKAASDEIIKAWEEAYFYLAHILIAKEKELSTVA